MAAGSDSIKALASALSEYAVQAMPTTSDAITRAAPSTRGTRQRCSRLTSGLSATLKISPSASGISTALAHCRANSPASTASTASEALRTLMGVCRCTRSGSGGAPRVSLSSNIS